MDDKHASMEVEMSGSGWDGIGAVDYETTHIALCWVQVSWIQTSQSEEIVDWYSLGSVAFVLIPANNAADTSDILQAN